MNFKIRSAILFTALVATILLVSYVVIYVSYASFKEDEFYLRLEQKALTTYKFLTEVKEIDYEMLKVIDRNTINALYNEKVLIFDSTFKLIYSSIDDQAISYSPLLLARINQEKVIHYKEGHLEVVGLRVNHQGSVGIVIASADDTYGEKKLTNLRYTLIASYLVALLLSGFLSYFYVKQSFAPLDILNKQIGRISQNRLNERVPVRKGNDELSQLAGNFNQMLERIESAFKAQRSFIQHASHELRTPLANLITTCESALHKNLSVSEYQQLIVSLNEEHRNLVEVTNALLLLSKYESMPTDIEQHPTRIDDVLFEAIEEVQLSYPEYLMKVDFNNTNEESDVQVFCNETLLKTALGNLLRNACKYSSSKEISIVTSSNNHEISISITNQGNTLDDEEAKLISQPFFRGKNAEQIKGYGLGLSIANRIIGLNGGRLSYTKSNQLNTFSVYLPLSNTKI